LKTYDPNKKPVRAYKIQDPTHRKFMQVKEQISIRIKESGYKITKPSLFMDNILDENVNEILMVDENGVNQTEKDKILKEIQDKTGCEKILENNRRMVFVSRVILGNCLETKQLYNYYFVPEGYDSVIYGTEILYSIDHVYREFVVIYEL